MPADELHGDVDGTLGVVVADGHGGEHAGGMPQLDAGSWLAQLFWLGLIFAGFYLFLSRVALPRVATVLEERRDRIANDLDQAALLGKRGDEAVAAYEQSLAEARLRAAGIAREMRDKVSAQNEALARSLDADLAARASDAEGRIASSRASAMSSVSAIATEAAEAMVARLTGHAPNRARIEAAIARVTAERPLPN